MPAGLKWGPVDMQPFVVSPNSWMWKPYLPSARREGRHRLGGAVAIPSERHGALTPAGR